MNRAEYYQARHDYRAAMRDLDSRHPVMSDQWSKGWQALYTVYGPRISARRITLSVNDCGGYLGFDRSMAAAARWRFRCNIPNSYPHKTRNP